MFVGNNAFSLNAPAVDSSSLVDRAIDPVSWNIGTSLQQGMLLEVATRNKPGLVSPSDNGAHDDMSLITFMVGASTLLPALVLCAQAGRDYFGSLPDLLPILRKIGIKYEQKLLRATGHVNTQRGALFSAAILAGAAGYESLRSDELEPDSILNTAAAITKGLVSNELNHASLLLQKSLTNGEKLFLEHGVTGIRGEVEMGFPSVKDRALPALCYAFEKGGSLESAFQHTLITLMSSTEDTNIISRKGYDSLISVMSLSQDVLDSGSIFSCLGKTKYSKLRSYCLDNNISPGGSADLLSITISIYLIHKKQYNVKVI